MPNNSFADYSTTPSLNTDIAGTSIAVGCPPADVGVYMRTLLAQIAYNVQGTPGLFTPTWHVGTLTASNITSTGASITNLTVGTLTPTAITTTGAITGAQFTPTGAVAPTTGMYGAGGQVAIATSGTLRMLYDAAGNLYLNTTSSNPITAGVGGLTFSSGTDSMIINSTATPVSLGINVSAGTMINFFAAGPNLVGQIVTTAGGTLYNTASDETLKVRIGDIAYADAAGVIDQICALWFSWKADPQAEVHPGFFAQQVYRACPSAVTPGRGKSGEKHYRPWQLDFGKLMPFVIPYIQGLSKRVADLERART